MCGKIMGRIANLRFEISKPKFAQLAKILRDSNTRGQREGKNQVKAVQNWQPFTACQHPRRDAKSGWG